MKSTIDKINKFRDDRDWRKFHNEKDLAISISIEASELLELFQWKESKEVTSKSLGRIKEELADVLIYSFMLADNLQLDVEKIIETQMMIEVVRNAISRLNAEEKDIIERLYFNDECIALIQRVKS